MKIKRIEIYGYGKWVNQQFDIDQQLQVFYGPNEIGKSTIQSFIKSILFGFPDKRRRKHQLNRFEPRHADTYGGRILITETEFGDVWVERTAKFLTIQDQEGQVLEDQVLDKILGGLDEQVFDYFYSFNLNNLQELSNVGSEDLNDYFLSIGTLGSDKFLSVAKKFHKETEEMYKRQGSNPKINQLLTEYDLLANQIQQVKQKHQRYDSLLQQKNAQTAAIDQLISRLNDLEQEIRNYDKLMNRYEIYLKDLVVQRKLDQLVYTDIPKEDPEILNATLRDNRESEKKVIEYQERNRQIDEELTLLTRYEWAKNREDDRKIWKDATDQIKQVQTQMEQVGQRIDESLEMLDHLAKQGQFYPEKILRGPDHDQAMDQGLEIQGQKNQLQTEMDQIKSERKMLLDQRKSYQNNASLSRQQVAKLENQRVNDEEQLIQQTQLSQYGLGFVMLLLSLGLGLSQLIQGKSLTDLMIILISIIGILGIGQMVYIFNRHRTIFAAFEENPIHQKIRDLQDQELHFNNLSKDLGIQINDRESLIENLQADQEKLHKQQVAWLNKIGFYPTADPEIILKTNPVIHYFANKDRYEVLVEEESQLADKISKWQVLIQPLLERFPSNHEEIRPLIRHVEDTEASLIQTVQRARALEDRRKLTQEAIEEEKDKIKKGKETIQEILDRAKARDLIDFKQKINTNIEIESLNDKHTMLSGQVSDYLDQLALVTNRQELSDKATELNQLHARTKENLTPHMHQLANVMVEIDLLQEDGSYEELSQKLENIKSKIKDQMIEWGQKKLATELIYDSLRYGMENPLPEMNEKVNAIFNKLSDGRYTEVLINKKSIKVRQFSDILFEPHELSQGTLEQLYVALRLAFVESAKQMVSMPIIIDDAFVNFDEKRRESMYQVLKEMSHRHQILFFTFDQLAIDMFESEKEINLERVQSSTGGNNE